MPFKADAASTTWVDSNRALADVVALWGDTIGIDTEFQRTNTYFPIPGLYQVIDGSRIYLIDPLAIDEWAPMIEALKTKTLVMHACSEDLELFQHHMSVAPQGIFDTQLANAFVCDDFSMSYANLVRNQLHDELDGKEMDKGVTRSNWLRRPLSERQLHYAAVDVWFLPQLHTCLTDQLREDQRWTWFAEEQRARGGYQLTDPQRYYRGVKKAWRLAPSELAVLQVLCAWREEQAVAEDVPRNRVVWDEHLLAFAQQRQLDHNYLKELLPKPVANRYAAELLSLHSAASRDGRDIEPLPEPLTHAQGKLVAQLRELGKNSASQLGIAPELLARKRDVESALRHFLAHRELPEMYHGWRHELLHDAFLQMMQQAT